MAASASPTTLPAFGAQPVVTAIECSATPGVKTEIVLPDNATGQALMIQAGAAIVSVYFASSGAAAASIAIGAIWTCPFYLRGGASFWISSAGISGTATITTGLAP